MFAKKMQQQQKLRDCSRPPFILTGNFLTCSTAWEAFPCCTGISTVKSGAPARRPCRQHRPHPSLPVSQGLLRLPRSVANASPNRYDGLCGNVLRVGSRARPDRSVPFKFERGRCQWPALPPTVTVTIWCVWGRLVRMIRESEPGPFQIDGHVQVGTGTCFALSDDLCVCRARAQHWCKRAKRFD